MTSETRNDRPIIGILALERTKDGVYTVYFSAAYVKFLEMAGARVVPVLPNLSEDEYKRLFFSINGILFPGGAPKASYGQVVKIFYDLAIEANDKGDYFPIWGTCLEVKESRMFKDFPADFMELLSTKPMAAHRHKWSLPTEEFNNNEDLKKFYRVLSIDHDGNTEYISTLEAINYPFYATQWHPEKNTFEWDEFTNHSPDGVRLTYLFATFFVGEARKSSHRFESEEEATKALVSRLSPEYTANTSLHTQIYFFEKTNV